MERKCYKCDKVKDLTDFKKSKHECMGYAYICKLCHNTHYSGRKGPHRLPPERREAAYTELRKLSGCCAICASPEAGNQLSVDHCHSTNAVRGLLCQKCNTGLGYFKDDPALLEAAALYLKRQSLVTDPVCV